MAEWPKTATEFRNPAGGVDSRSRRVIPADLGRELYEALKAVDQHATVRNLAKREQDHELDLETGRRLERLRVALAPLRTGSRPGIGGGTVSETKREWTGGGYEGREGITVEADRRGITISGWYDGGPDLEVIAELTWEELERLRENARDVSDTP